MIDFGVFVPFMMCVFCMVYLAYLSFMKSTPQHFRLLGMFQILMCSVYLAGMHLEQYRHTSYIATCEIVYFSLLSIVNSEFYRHNFADVKRKAREFIAFIRVIHTLPEADKEKINKAYFDKFPRLELLQSTTRRVIYVVETINVIIMVGSILFFLNSRT